MAFWPINTHFQLYEYSTNWNTQFQSHDSSLMIDKSDSKPLNITINWQLLFDMKL